MNMVLKRQDAGPTGVFSTLQPERLPNPVFYTVEHSYQTGLVWLPKLPPGLYVCKRGMHQLHSGPIETFEITNVPGHTGVLFHPGNKESASEGCVCLGMSRQGDAVLESRRAFDWLMSMQQGLSSFMLTVI